MELTDKKSADWFKNLDPNNCKDVSEFLHKIVEGDTLKEHSKRCETNANDIMKFVENNLVSKMKEQSVEFRDTYRRIYGTGSYYDGLRIVSDSRNTELDINIVLSLFSPTLKECFPEGSIKVITNESVPDGFVKILADKNCINELQMKRGENFRTKCFFKKVDENKNSKEPHREPKNFLHPNKTLHWFCKLVESSIKQIKSSDLVGIKSFSEVPMVLPRQGPSQPIQFTLNSPSKTKIFANVDLVVAFEFNANLYNPLDTTRDDRRKLKYDTETSPFFFAIPKVMQSKKLLDKEKEAGTTSKSDSLNWRIDFHDQERIILDSEKYPLAKPTIKIMKLYKHVHTLKLSSYLIKSTVMWLLVRTHEQKMFMAGHKLDETVLSTMNIICSFLAKKKAPYLFDNKCNLFWKTSPDDLHDMFLKISKDIDRLKKGKIETWCNLLITKLPLLDEVHYVKRGDACGRAQSWKQNKKRNNNYQEMYRAAQNGDENIREILGHVLIGKPNRNRDKRKK